MNAKKPFFLLLSMLIVCTVFAQNNIHYLTKDKKNISFKIENIPFKIGNWEDGPYGEEAVSVGNHRALVRIEASEEAVYVKIPWRRHDPNPERKTIIIQAVSTGKTIEDKIIKSALNEFGEVIFRPISGETDYYFYYFPYKTTGGYYPVVSYLENETTTTTDWLSKYANSRIENLPKAEVVQIEARNAFHSFYPMEIIATESETSALLSQSEKAFFMFPEYRDNPIRLKHYLPHHWTQRELLDGLNDVTKKGEYYTFQIGLYSNNSDLHNIGIEKYDLISNSAVIPKNQISCFNSEGINYDGTEMSKEINVKKGDVQALWFGIEIPENCKSGEYSGMIVIKPEGLPSDTCYISIEVSEEVALAHGDNEPEKMGRLRWLNSTLGSDNDFVIDPFTPVDVDGKTISILGRDIRLNAFGLPSQITSYFSDNNTEITEKANALLSDDIQFIIRSSKEISPWTHKTYKINRSANGLAEWITISENNYFTLQVKGRIEYDGMLETKIRLFSKTEVPIEDIALNIFLENSTAEYLLGLGYKGCKLPKNIDWKWDVKKHQEGAWIGTVNKGLQFVLRDENYERPLNTNFYHSKPLKMPESWYNDGKGGIKISKSDNITTIHNYSGERLMKKGDILNFNVRLLLTPFKPIDFENHFNTRFVHKYVPIDSALKWGGTVINVHHANEINPYINYPFHNLQAQKDYIDEAHSKGVKVKLYNTIRELSYKTYEIFALRSLGDEIFNDGEGGGHPWLQEHLEDNYHKAWHAWRVDDASILNKGTSRWTNYYIEGLNWLAKNQEIDGLYLDDVAFNRETVKRMVAVLNKHRNEVVIDLHSANQYNDRDGYINSAFLYMEHLPYISRLWFGEYFEYDLDPDYWLTEISGIPFGLTGEMLQDCGRPYRGLIYGMTTRVYGSCDPRALWALMDDFGIAESTYYPYWRNDSPVKCTNENIKIASYKSQNEILVVVASWAETDQEISLVFDQEHFDEMPQKGIVPAIKDMQEYREVSLKKSVTIPANGGLIFKVEL